MLLETMADSENNRSTMQTRPWSRSELAIYTIRLGFDEKWVTASLLDRYC